MNNFIVLILFVILFVSLSAGTAYAITQLDSGDSSDRLLVSIGDGVAPQTQTDSFEQGTLLALPRFSPTSNTGTTSAMNFFSTYDPGSGVTITNGIGLWIRGTQSGAGTVTNGYGLYSDLSAAGGYGINKYPAVFIGGNVGIGTITPVEQLDVVGNIRLTGNIVSPNDICIGNCP